MEPENGWTEPGRPDRWRMGLLLAALALPLAIHFAPARDADESRSYTEMSPDGVVVRKASAMDADEGGTARSVDPGLSWVVPEGWLEERGGGARLATLRPRDADGSECTIVAIQGTAGSLRENVRRWADQIGAVLDEAAVARLAAGQQVLLSRDGSRVRLLDFAMVTGNGAPSLLVAIVFDGRTTYFLKLGGKREILEARRDQFLKLCRSLAIAGSDA